VSAFVAAENRTKLTYRYERWRAISAGVIETAGTTFLLLVAVRGYQAGAFAKALVAGGGSLGLILAPWLVSRVEAAGWHIARAASRLAALGACSFLVMALVSVLPVFVAGSVLAMACTCAAIPLMTQIYQENYPEAERGRRFARTIMIRIAVAVVFGQLAGLALSDNTELEFLGHTFSGGIGHFPWLLLTFAGAFAFASYCLARVPSRPLTASGGIHPFRALKYVRQDRVFRQTLISWMFLGFATLMMAPLRVEYLANSKHGVTLHGAALTAGAVALLTSVIPNIARLILNPLWGWLFDRMNFFVLRITLNLGFAMGILSFFTTGSMTGLIVGAIFYGAAAAGGDVAWSLWVTKFAPPERVADYMSVHTFFTGVRGVVAPLVAFQLVSGLSLNVMGWVSAGLILVGTSFLIPEIKFGKGARRATALVEEVSE
jgi:MFS family permease